MLKMYRKCTKAPIALFLMLEMFKHWHPKFQSKEEFPLRFRELILMLAQKNIYKIFSLGQVAKTNLQNF